MLKWNDAAGSNVWTATAITWLDSTNGAAVWQPGAEARFEGSGGLIQIAADVSATNLTFTGNGYALLGAGRLAVEGAISVADATTNSIAADLVTGGGLTKSGLGALALARCTGPLAVQAGMLLVSGSGFVDADLSVASGATVVTLGDPDTASNLILNPSFEYPAITNSLGWNYVGTANLISNWTATVQANFVGRQNTAISSIWNALGSSPDGTHMLILQIDGTVAQTVTVPADGLYSVAFSHFMRNINPENQVYVTLDGIPLASFLNRSVQFSPGRFASGALWLKAGSHTLGIGGEGGWGDRSSMIDAVCFAAPSSGNACRALTGDSVLKVVTGATVRLDHSGTVPLAYVATNGAAASGTFNSSHASGIFTSGGALSCAAPANVFNWTGTGLWSAASRWTDGAAPAASGSQNLLLRFPNGTGAASTNDLAGTFLARRLSVSGTAKEGSFRLAGNPVALTNDASGTAPKLSVAAPGTWTVSAPVTARSALTLDVAGALTFSGNTLTLPNSSTFYKSGAGIVTVPTLTNTVAAAYVYEGSVQTPSLPSGLAVSLLSQTNKSSALYLTQGGVTLANQVNLMGSGISTLATRCGGGSLTFGWTFGFGNSATFDVGTNDILSLGQLLLVNFSGSLYSVTALVKTGPGTLELRSAGSDTGNNRAYQGATILRNGTLKISEDDYGTLNGWTNPFNGRTYDGKGGSLGYSAFNNTVRIGDSGTAPSDDLKLVANGNGRYVGHNIEVFNVGNTVIFNMTTGSVMFANTVTLHRDVTLSGPADGVMVFSNIVAAADYSGIGMPTLSGLACLQFEGAVPAGMSLNLGGRRLRFGMYSVRATTLNALSIGSAAASATLDVDFGGSGNDTVAVTAGGGLVISNTVVNLYYAGSGLPFAEPGTYTLFSYAGTLGGDVALLSIGNPQSGASYAFSNDTANARVLLTVGNTSGGSSAIWKNPTGGAWALGSNWDSGTAPDAAGVTPLFGLAISSPATVDLGTARTVGGLTFNNASYGYTLSGGSLTFDNGGSTSTVSVFSGTHTLDTALAGSSGLSVSAASGATLVLGTNASVSTGLSLASGTLRVIGTNVPVGSLSGAASATLALSGTAPKLTVSQSQPGTFAGTLSGLSSSSLEKAGTAALTLTGPNTSFAGALSVSQGNLALQGVSLAAPTAVAAAGGLDVLTAATNGLMGYYYSVTPNTANFATLAAMESHFATLTPDLAVLSGWAGALFDFGVGATYTFPAPYSSTGSRPINFEAVWRGVIMVPLSGYYTFGVTCDDGFALAVDGQTVMTRAAYVAAQTEGGIRLDAGRYDIVLGYFQVTGGGGIQLRVRTPGSNGFVLVPNAWLAPYSSSGTLTGSGGFTANASNALFRTVQNSGLATFGGDLSGPSGALFAKTGNGVLLLSGAGAVSNAFAGDLEVQGGLLALMGNERLGDAATLRVRTGASLAVAGAETVGVLAGGGSLVLGGGYVYATPFNGDADSDISTAKTYTHLLDFPAGTASPSVNGVTFNSVGTSGSSGAYGWSVIAGTAPGSAWNTAPIDSTRTGIDSLLWDFYYNSADYTLTLSGLTPGQSYEARLYFRSFTLGATRNVTFSFSTGAAVLGSLTHNIDALARTWVGCRYVASGTSLAIRVVSVVPTTTCHLYGLSNERVDEPLSPALTIATAAGRNDSFTGPVAGYGALVKTGAGTQRFSGANTLPSPLEVRTGKVTLDAGATVLSGAVVNAGATLAVPVGNVTLGALSGGGTFNLTGSGIYTTNAGPYFVTFTNDATTGISPDKTYTHLLDFGPLGNPVAVINGVAFDKVTSAYGPIVGYGWTNFPTGTASGSTPTPFVPAGSGIYNLLYDINYNTVTGVVRLTGLTIGKRYEVRLYNRVWGVGGNRTQVFLFDPDGTGPISDAVTFNPDQAGSLPNFLGYRYTAATNYLAITIQLTIATFAYHIYGLSNEEVYDSLLNPATLDIAGVSAFDGVVTGPGGWTKTGAGRLTLTGTSTNTGPLAVNAGAFGVANNGRATAGPVTVASGATLFGHGLVGGDVTVASNAWVQAGTASACGTLQIGGSLALAPGTRIAWRFDTAASDAFTVNGLLSFPTNGVVQASALTAGVNAPAKAVLFASPQTINGPADLTGWTVAGVNKASLKYSADRKTIYFSSPRGTLILVR